MARNKILKFMTKPWNGSWNTSLDASLIQPNELVTADNFIYSNTGSRRRRGGLVPFGYVALGATRSSIGKTRTVEVTVNAGVTIADTDTICVFGSSISAYNTQSVAVDTADTSGGNRVLTYTADTDLFETSIADTDIRVMLLSTARIVGMFDFWYFDSGTSTKKQAVIAVRSDGTFWKYTNIGSCTPITITSGTLSATAATAYFAALGGRLVISFDEPTNEPVIYTPSTNAITAIKNLAWDGTTDRTATNPPPNFSVMRVYKGRIFANNKVNPDQVLYSDIEEPERWNGEGDSGGFEFDGGDSDNSGITAILPPFKGVLSFTKQNKLYQLAGDDPVNFIVDQLSTGLGCEAHKSAVAVDQDDIFFLSKRGFNSLIASANFGNFESKFLSSPIQSSVTDDLDLLSRNYCTGVYMPEYNSIIWSVNTGGTYNNEFWLYNIPFNAWHRWVSDSTILQSVTSLTRVDSAARDSIYLLGLSNGSIYKYNDGAEYDGVNTSITFKIKSGLVYLDDQPNRLKAFKTVTLLLKLSRESYDVDVSVKIDTHKAQYNKISLTSSGDLLGSTFTLGGSLLGVDPQIITPYPINIDGYGHSISLELVSEGVIDSFGYIIEFELADDQQDIDA